MLRIAHSQRVVLVNVRIKTHLRLSPRKESMKTDTVFVDATSKDVCTTAILKELEAAETPTGQLRLAENAEVIWKQRFSKTQKKRMQNSLDSRSENRHSLPLSDSCIPASMTNKTHMQNLHCFS